MIAKKSFGQHFLHNQGIIKRIVDAADVQPGETILEIGPGRGVLTQALVEAGAHVVAVEADRDLIPVLEEAFGDKIDLVFADALAWNPANKINGPYKLVSNLPYNIASAIIEKFLSVEPRPSRMVIMVQKEVAERMLAKPGDMSLLSVASQIYAKVRRVVNVSPGSFRPMPNVDSTVVQLDLLPDVSPKTAEAVIKLAKAGFTSRRKQLHGNLADAHIATSEQGKSALVQFGLPVTARAQELSVEQWIQLWNHFSLSAII